jgi:divalent metal cation (Fe/Co/Zn/Cd) transporter
VANLIDKADDDVLKKMLEVTSDCKKPEWVDIHNMKVIKYGSNLFVDCDLTLPWFFNIDEGHRACEELKSILSAKNSDRVLVSIHSDPCKEEHCEHCLMKDCVYRKTPFVAPLSLTMEDITASDEERKENP